MQNTTKTSGRTLLKVTLALITICLLWTTIATGQTCDKPVIDSTLPAFMPNTFLSVEYEPNPTADLNELCYFDSADGEIMGCYDPLSSKSHSLPLSLASTVTTYVENLSNGHTYGYFVKAYCNAISDTSRSDTIFVTQDATAPDSVVFDTAGTNPTRATAEAGGKIALDWLDVSDAVSSVNRYEIYRKVLSNDYVLIDIVADTLASGKYLYYDSLDGATSLPEGQLVFYRVQAVDTTGNRGGGVVTIGVEADATAPDIPTLSVSHEYERNDTLFARGVSLYISGASNSTAPAGEADSILFEVARDDTAYFGGSGTPGVNFYTTGWIPYTPIVNTVLINLLPEDGDSSYVNGHHYHVRCMAKDDLGQASAWSDTSVTMDAFPPSAIANLAAEPNPYIEGVDSAAMIITWDAALDAVSGIKWYHVYRRRDTINTTWTLIDSVPDGTTEYRDHYSDVDGPYREPYCYKLSIEDNVGNVRQSSDSVCALPTLPPIIHIGNCQTEIALEPWRCYRSESSFEAVWTMSDTTDVIGYVVRWNGGDIEISGADILSVNIETPDYVVVAVRVQAVYSDSSRSHWSVDAAVSIYAIEPPVLSGLTVSEAPEDDWSGNIYVDWDKPDSADVWAYVIRRRDSLGTFVSLDTNAAVPQDFSSYEDTYDEDVYASYEPLTAYQWYVYEVTVMNWLWNERDPQSAQHPIDSAYCNKPPTIDSSTVVEDRMKIWWTRPMPNLVTDPGNWGDSIHVTKLDTLDNEIEVGVYRNDGVDFFTLAGLNPLNPADTGRYVFRVREFEKDANLIENDTDLVMQTSWSEPFTVPYNSLPAAVDVFVAQPQPLHPDDNGTSAAQVYLSWQHSKPEVIETFIIVRTDEATPDQSDTIYVQRDPDNEQFDYMDFGLNEDHTYNYTILARDSMGQDSPEQHATIELSPHWAYTPQVEQFDPEYFNDSTIEVSWFWQDGDTNRVEGENYGADSIVLQISKYSNFNGDPYVETRLSASGSPQVVSLDGTEVCADNPTLYFRIRGIDAYGNEQANLWSTDYFEDTISAFLDDSPPRSVVDSVIDSSVAVIDLVTDSIHVFLSWTAVEDRGGSGMNYYVIYRTTPPDTGWYAIDTTSGTTYTDGIRVSSAQNCDYSYRIHGVDRANNEQETGNTEDCLKVLSPPTIDTVIRFTDEGAFRFRVIFSDFNALVPDSFIVQAALDSSGFPTDDLQQGIAPGTDSVYIFPQDWADSTTEIFMRMKAVRGTNESGWSDIKFWLDSMGTGITQIEDDVLPVDFLLGDNYPNPFNPSTDIPFAIPHRCRIVLTIYNVVGQQVEVLVNRELSAGNYIATWDGHGTNGETAATGIYFYRLSTESMTMTKKMVLIK